MNRYSYVGNDPVNAFDPLGMFIVCLGLFHDGELIATLWCEDIGGGGGGIPQAIPGGGGGGGGSGAGASKVGVVMRLLNPECAALFGGLQNALRALAVTQYLPFSQAPQEAQNERALNPTTNAYTISLHIGRQVPSSQVVDVKTYLDPSFFNQTQSAQEIEQIHELFHGVGYNPTDPSPLDASTTVDKLTEQQRADIDKKCPKQDVPTTTSNQ
jgi:hypothetical protein